MVIYMQIHIQLINRLKLTKLTVAMFVFSYGSSIFAGDFYTIIGPDGRPMVIQQKTEKKKEKKVNSEQIKQQDAVQKNVPPLKNNDQVHSAKKAIQEKLPVENDHVQSPNSTLSLNTHQKKQDQVASKQSESLAKAEAKNHSIPVHANSEKIGETNLEAKIENLHGKAANNAVQNNAQENKNELQTQSIQHQVLSNQNEKIEKVFIPTSKENSSKASTNFTEIDGVKYVDNEYLENREFNLERRKRFYVIPDTGTARQFEAVEREKGISKSMLNKFMSKGETDEYKPVVLSPTYYRLPKQAVIESLEQACFTGKKIEKAKSLSQKNKEVGLWPVSPLKEKFVYEIVRMDADVQNIQFNSYASSQKNPNYYWPLVVFLDQKGCVMEGVSGFKNENKKDSNFQHAALEGVLKKPDGAVYLFMTPLAESVDVQDAQLSNQGQIKLTVLK